MLHVYIYIQREREVRGIYMLGRYIAMVRIRPVLQLQSFFLLLLNLMYSSEILDRSKQERALELYLTPLYYTLVLVLLSTK